MTPVIYLKTLTALRDQAERAQVRVAEAAEAERQSERQSEDAAAEVDRLDDADPHAAERAKAELGIAQDAASAARKNHRSAQAVFSGVRRALDDHESQARAAFDAGLAALGEEASQELDRAAVAWTAAVQALAEAAARAAALESAVGSGISIYSPLPYVSPEIFTVLNDGISRTLEALRVPALGTGGFDHQDRLADADRAREGARTISDFSELSDRHAALGALAREVTDIGKRQTQVQAAE